MPLAPPQVLIPSHGLEDLVSELTEAEAASVLNGFAVAWDPYLLAASEGLPVWNRGDLPPEDFTPRVVVVSQAAQKHLPTGWQRRAEAEGERLAFVRQERDESITQVRTALDAVIANLQAADSEPSSSSADTAGSTAPVASQSLAPAPIGWQPSAEQIDLAADFHALGLTWLLLQIFSRQSHFYVDMNDAALSKRVVTAAAAWRAGDMAIAREELRTCFELLLEARERCYGSACYLVEMCLLWSQSLGPAFLQRLQERLPMELALSADDARLLADKPELLSAVKVALSEGRLGLAGGAPDEDLTSSVPRTVMTDRWLAGLKAIHDTLGERPTTWFRRTDLLGAWVPGFAKKLQYRAAMHWHLDEGVYPDAEASRLEWDGHDGTVLPASSRLPLTIETANGLLKLPQQLADSMNHDQNAMLILAHWPNVKTPWLQDLQRGAAYQPVLGKFTTFAGYFSDTQPTGHISSFDQSEYFSPALSRLVAAKTPDPISNFTRQVDAAAQTTRDEWFRQTVGLLSGSTDLPPATSAASELTRLICRGDARSGWLIANPCSFARTAVVTLEGLPAESEHLLLAQQQGATTLAVVKLPAAGFAYLPAATPHSGKSALKSSARSTVPLAVDQSLRNEKFQLLLNPRTGGIQEIKPYRRVGNLLSLQLALRYPQSRTICEDGEPTSRTTEYSLMRADHFDVVSDGPVLGQIRVRGRLVDPTDGTLVADFTQTYSVWRHCGALQVDTSLQPAAAARPTGNPWRSYFALRFAWGSSSAAVTGSLQDGAFAIRTQRIESPEYLEIADSEARVTIVPAGRPFHVSTGDSTLDSPLIVVGETSTQFRTWIAIDNPHPREVAEEHRQPPVVMPVGQPPVGPASGWFFHVSDRAVQIARLLPAVHPISGQRLTESKTAVILEVVECEGRHRVVQVRLPRNPVTATVIDFCGKRLIPLETAGDTLTLEISGREIMWVLVEC